MPRPSYVPRQPSHDTHDMHNGRFPQPPCVSSHAQLPIFLTHEAPADNVLACQRLVTPLCCHSLLLYTPAIPRRMVCSPSSSPATFSVPRQPGCSPADMPLHSHLRVPSPSPAHAMAHLHRTLFTRVWLPDVALYKLSACTPTTPTCPTCSTACHPPYSPLVAASSLTSQQLQPVASSS